MASRRARIIGVTLGGLALAAIVAVSVTRDRRSKVNVLAQKVARRDLVSVVSASGEIKPKRFVNVSANVSGRIVSLEHYGASADYKKLYAEYGITAEAVAQAAKESIEAAS